MSTSLNDTQQQGETAEGAASPSPQNSPSVIKRIVPALLPEASQPNSAPPSPQTPRANGGSQLQMDTSTTIGNNNNNPSSVISRLSTLVPSSPKTTSSTTQNGQSSPLSGSPQTSAADGLRQFASRKYQAVASFLSIALKDEEIQQHNPLRLTWSDFEAEYEKECQTLPEGLRFPNGEVLVRRIEKCPRYIFPPTVGLVMGGLEQHVKDIIHHFYKDYLIVQNKSELARSQSGRRSSAGLASKSAMFSLANNNNTSPTMSSSPSEHSNPLKSQLFSRTKISASINGGGGKGNVNISTTPGRRTIIETSGDDLISFMAPPSITTTATQDPLKQLIPERYGLELLCEVKELKFLHDIEPLFCTLYIVDLDKRERISENFNFHLNSKQMLDSLKINSDTILGGWACQRQALFSLNKYHPNMYFILRVYHIFRGDIEKDIKPYIKDYKKQNKPNVITQFKAEIVEKCSGWGASPDHHDLQPLAWGAYPVFHRPTLTTTTQASASTANLLQYLQQQQPLPQSPSQAQSTPATPLSPPQSPSPTINSTSPPYNPMLSPPSVNMTKARSYTPPPNIPTPPPPPMSPSTTPPIIMSPHGNKTNIEIVGMVPCTPNLNDRSICELLINDKDLRKMKTVQASFTMTLRTLDTDEEVKGRISPSLVPLLPTVEPENLHQSGLIRDIQDFSETPYPFVEYINNLYIYPDTALIKSYKNPNLQIQVQLVEDLVSLKAIKCVYPTTPPYIPTNLWDKLNMPGPGQPGPTPSMPFPPLDFGCYSSVSFHDKRPLFVEEFKLKLPTKLTGQHLLFTFYHSNPNSKKEQKTAIGYAAISLLQAQGMFLRDDIYHIPISSELSSTLDTTIITSEENKKEKREYFTFRLKLVSSVITQDTNISMFFRHFSSEHNSIGRTQEVVKGIQKIDRLSCVQFFPSILDQLFQIMVCCANDVAMQAFSSILHVIKIVDGYEKKAGTEKSRLLTYYSEYMFDYVPDSKNLYEELCRQWLHAMHGDSGGGSTKTNSNLIFVKDFRLNWFLFDIMTKSMALSLANSSQLDSDLGRENRFKVEFQENLHRLVLKLLPQSDSTNMSVQSWEFFTKFPYFINNLFPLIDRGFLYNLIYSYIARIVTFSNGSEKDKDNIALITIKFNFLKIICDYDHYIPLNFPLPIQVVDSISDLTTKFFKRHFIAVLLINEVEACLKQNKPSIRNHAILTLKQLLKKHHYDPRYQMQDIREKIATIYFPFVLMMVEHYSILSYGLDAINELPEWLTCLIWILQYCNRSLLRVWFQKETETRQLNFLSIMLLSLETFKDEPSIHEIIQLDIEICKLILEDFKSIEDKVFNMVMNNIQRASTLATHDLLPEVYKLIRETLIPNHSINIFQSSQNSYCEILSYELFCAADSPKLANEASTLFYQLLDRNFATTNDVARMKVQSTVAISKLVGELKLDNSNNLTAFLSRVRAQLKDHGSQTFQNHVDELITRINTLIKYANTITANRSDIEMVAEMYYNIANNYFESPNLRVTWLENLSKKNTDNAQYDEAAQCLIQSAFLISRYLFKSGKYGFVGTTSDYVAICPNIPNELELPPLKDDTVLQAWTLEYMIHLLEHAIELGLRANRYELAIEIHSLISGIYKSKKDYRSMITTLSNQKTVCETMVEKSKDRFQPKYYRISFIGSGFEEMDGKEYIYKKPADCLLKHIQTQIREYLNEKFGKTLDQNLVLLPNAPFDRASLDASKLYFQIINVDAYIELSQLSAADGKFDQYFGVSQFISETAYSHEGKAIQEDLSKQLKKKTIFSVEPASFPYMKNRIEITSKREIILSPIENAIELIKARTVKMVEQLNTSSPSINLVQQLLQGTVLPMVNEGPLKICEVFLPKCNPSSPPTTPVQYKTEHVEQLRKEMCGFLHYSQHLIRLNKRLITPQHQDFHSMVEKHFEQLKKDMQAYGIVMAAPHTRFNSPTTATAAAPSGQ
ncbi:hypothetical protein SAMD00019534_118390 [Acytostelium subglobosum LB1]|uniref:hypothetical protein n=1 Tax=Acytostelium subglobosum LB1 TaxID=1410327 RepID=UPI0006448EFC|nr:hypothetical protein SAMD00019534_118390 [Acytostelium subglobosum LB1]GAM28663.1 hypothetical protein SAMD00019534_118390 [Acytostelium subglobosum LB1]|eukprot:XP_012748441.1 hypothetical protein SAMD00019534_118390 [Acytostelium subglobosum LB1]